MSESEVGAFSINGVVSTISETIAGIWKDFIGRVPFLVAGIIVIALTWAASSVVSRITYRVLKGSDLRQSLKELIIRFISVGIWIIGILLAAMVVFPGITPSKALGAMGIASVAVGFAFKDIFENFFAGILLLWKFPFENGDFIECNELMGSVEEVSVRNTKLRLPTDELVVVPNGILFKNPVRVLTNRDRRRIDILAGVAYGENLKRAVEVIEKAVRSCNSVDKDFPVQIFPKGFGSSSMDIQVAWWTQPKPVDIRRSRAEVVTAIKHTLDAEGIEIPFPYRTLVFKEPVGVNVGGLPHSRSVKTER